MSKYDDIINLEHHVSKNHPQMPLENRAAQFAPFAALSGYGEAVNETGRITITKEELSEFQKESLNKKLKFINDNLNYDYLIVYFAEDLVKDGGEYREYFGKIKKVDEFNQYLVGENNLKLKFGSLYQIDCENFE